MNRLIVLVLNCVIFLYMMRQQHDSELEMELIPRQISIGIDSSSSTPPPTASSKQPSRVMSMNQFTYF